LECHVPNIENAILDIPVDTQEVAISLAFNFHGKAAPAIHNWECARVHAGLVPSYVARCGHTIARRAYRGVLLFSPWHYTSHGSRNSSPLMTFREFCALTFCIVPQHTLNARSLTLASGLAGWAWQIRCGPLFSTTSWTKDALSIWSCSSLVDT